MSPRPVANAKKVEDLCDDELLGLSRLALDVSSDLCMLADREGRILYANKTACRALGYTKNELLSMKVMDFDACYDEKRYSQFWDEVKRSCSLKLESVHVRKDGSRFPVRMTISFIKLGEKEYVFNFIQDITERKQAEEALKESKTFLNNVFESIQDGISVLDTSLNIMSVNPVMEKWYGTGIVGKKCFEVYHGRHSPCEKCPSVRAMRERTTKSEVVQDIRSWVEIYAFPYFDDAGQVKGVIEHVRDVTERKRAEEALGVSEESYRSLVESTGDWVWETDKDFVLTYDSPRSREYLGYEPDEVVGRSPFSFMLEDELERIKLIAWPVIARHEPITRIENRLKKKDGSTVIIETTGVPLFDDSGHFRGYRGVNRDITDRKIAEYALQDARAQAELYLDLMGHDINNLHQIALGYLELARSIPPGSGQGDYLDKSIEVLQRSTQLIKNVRKLQKLSDGVSASQDIDVCLVIAEMQREFGAVPGKTIMLNLNGHEHCYVRANELLPDLFVNLISNAIKHSGERAEIIVDLDVVKDKCRRYCRVMVEDNGPGIPDDFKGRIFNRMLRGTTKAKGMGLGLYLVKSLVESYNGKVWVEDRVSGDHSKGARFVVMLPAVEQS
jgi:PAS domain S-box-containing protein